MFLRLDTCRIIDRYECSIDNAFSNLDCTILNIREFLNQKFPQCWIDRDEPINWPHRLTDPSPMILYLWNHAKLVYENEMKIENQLWTCIQAFYYFHDGNIRKNSTNRSYTLKEILKQWIKIFWHFITFQTKHFWT